jgi:selenium-binding protein 1
MLAKRQALILAAATTAVLSLVAFATPVQFSADESPWVKVPLKPGEMESLLYVWTRDADHKDSDFLAVVDVDRKSSTFSKIIATAPTGVPNNEAHHFGYTASANRIFAGGMFSNKVFIYDVASDPRRPKLIRTVDLTSTGYTGPHTFYAVPGGVLIAMLGGPNGGAPGGLVLLNDDGDFVETYPKDKSTAPTYMYDVGVKPEMNRMITSSFAHPEHAGHKVPEPSQVGSSVVVWDWEKKQVIQTVELDLAPLEVRWLHAPHARGGYINCAFGSTLWRWSDDNADGVLEFERVISFPENSVPVDVRISQDDRYLFVSLWGGGKVQQYDIADKQKPRLISEIALAQPNMMKLTPDGRRLYVTNSLLRTMDGDVKFAAWKIDVSPDGMRVDETFRPDFASLPTGPSGPHDLLLR